MKWNFSFFFNSILLGAGLAMDAFSVSLANGLNEPKMKKSKLLATAGVFGVFQGVMPMIGWICVHTVLRYFKSFEKLIPWIALFLLAYIGGKMLYDSLVKKEDEAESAVRSEGIGAVLVQGVATSIDAFSVGFTIADYNFFMALISALIIAFITFVICVSGIAIGKKFGTKLAGKAQILGGVILVAIGFEIFLTGIF